VKEALMDKRDKKWREMMDDETYRITREGGTERAFAGIYWDHKEEGVYRCVCCHQALFISDTKYDSGSGWPSFYEPAASDALLEKVDNSHGMVRVEIRCSGCESHLGHRFEDGPQPSGQRYCVNSASLVFNPSPSSDN
jgi:peptide-methionine (R)-S-oxide reductase